MKIETRELKAKLELLKPALAKAGSIAELKHFWFDGEFAYAFDGGMGIKVELETEFKGGVPGAPLLGFLQNAPDQIEVSEERAGLLFKHGRHKITLATLEEDRFPWRYPEEPTKPRELKLTKSFISALNKVNCIRAAVPVRVEHHGVTLFPDGKGTLFYTTDSKSMAEAYVDVAIDPKLAKTVLPRAFVDQIVALAKEGDVCSFADHIVLVAPTATVYSNLLDSSTVQDLPGVVSKKVPAKLSALAKIPPELKVVLGNADLLAKGQDKAYVTLITKGKELILKGGYIVGVVDSAFDLEKAAPKAEIQVELESLQTGLRHTDSFQICEDALCLVGDDERFLFLIARHEEPRTKTKVAKEED